MPQWPMPRLMSNHGNFIGSLGDVCRYLGRKAEELGVEIYPGFPAAEVLVDGESRVVGVATGDLGIGRDGKPKDSFTRGMELRGRYTVFAEGARGNLTKQLIHRFNLDRGRDHQKYGIGIKELWQVAPEKHKAGLVQHSMGWPLPNHAGGGSWLYHFGDNLVSVGFVVHLNYQNPTLSPFDEFQRFKTHPMIRATFEGGKRIGYGARAIMEGGWQAVPRLTFPGGCLVGDTAGFVNVPRIKGTHNAVLSGMLCAEHLFPALQAGRANDEVSGYEEAWRSSEIGRDLYRVRNVKPLWSRLGTFAGVSLGGLDMWLSELFGWSPFGTMRHGKPDHATLKPLAEVEPIVYPKPDGVLTFDRLSSVFLSNTNHEEDQPSHLVLADPSVPDPREPAPLWRAGPPLLPGRRLRGRLRRRRAAHRPEVRDQRPELRPLQNLRHQGPGPEHQLGHPGRGRGAELRRDVTTLPPPPRSGGGGPCEAWWRGRAGAQIGGSQGLDGLVLSPAMTIGKNGARPRPLHRLRRSPSPAARVRIRLRRMRAPLLTFKRARALRRAMTLPEVLLWQAVRGGQVGGLRFRRQHPIGPYVLEFYCPAIRLAVEIDGAAHDTPDRADHDLRRDAWLAGQGSGSCACLPRIS